MQEILRSERLIEILEFIRKLEKECKEHASGEFNRDIVAKKLREKFNIDYTYELEEIAVDWIVIMDYLEDAIRINKDLAILAMHYMLGKLMAEKFPRGESQ